MHYLCLSCSIRLSVWCCWCAKCCIPKIILMSFYVSNSVYKYILTHAELHESILSCNYLIFTKLVYFTFLYIFVLKHEGQSCSPLWFCWYSFFLAWLFFHSKKANLLILTTQFLDLIKSNDRKLECSLLNSIKDRKSIINRVEEFLNIKSKRAGSVPCSLESYKW